MLEVTGVSKVYGRRTALDDVTFTAASGEIAAVAGPNGAGKSTLLGVIAGIVRPDSGDVRIDGRPVANGAPAAAGYVPQTVSLHQNLSVRDNLHFWSTIGGGPGVQSPTARSVIDMAGLGSLLPLRVDRLSGGQKQKVNIAAALLHEPDILLLDEPTAGIDIQTRSEITGFLRQLAGDGTTVVYSSHDAGEIETLCDTLLMLHDGRLRFSGPPAAARSAADIEGSPAGSDFADVLARLGGWDPVS